MAAKIPKRRNRRRASKRPRGGARSGRQSRAPKRNRRKQTPARAAARRRAAKNSGLKRFKPLAWRVLALGALLVGCVFGIAAVAHGWFAARRSPETGESVAVSWPAGLSAGQAADLLGDLKLTDSPLMMALFLRINGAAACAKPGPQLLPAGATPAELAAMLCRLRSRPTVKLVIPEGQHRFELAKRLAKLGIADEEAFLHACLNESALYALGVEPRSGAVPMSAEGYLFPATYEFATNTAPADVVARLVKEWRRRFDKLVQRDPGGWERLQAERDYTAHEVMILASMVEKEAVVNEERPTIASVFLNRLADPKFKHLQSDPTAMYGCVAIPERVPACAGFDGRASGAINRDRANVFSTYVTRGLPPAPIANPGEASIAAVLQFKKSNYRFFVAKGGGRHAFSVDYAEHLRAVKALRKKRRR